MKYQVNQINDCKAKGKKHFYCNKINMNVTIKSIIKRPPQCEKDEGWRLYEDKGCTGNRYCNNEDCKHLETFYEQEQK